MKQSLQTTDQFTAHGQVLARLPSTNNTQLNIASESTRIWTLDMWVSAGAIEWHALTDLATMAGLLIGYYVSFCIGKAWVHFLAEDKTICVTLINFPPILKQITKY